MSTDLIISIQAACTKFDQIINSLLLNSTQPEDWKEKRLKQQRKNHQVYLKKALHRLGNHIEEQQTKYNFLVSIDNAERAERIALKKEITEEVRTEFEKNKQEEIKNIQREVEKAKQKLKDEFTQQVEAYKQQTTEHSKQQQDKMQKTVQKLQTRNNKLQSELTGLFQNGQNDDDADADRHDVADLQLKYQQKLRGMQEKMKHLQTDKQSLVVKSKNAADDQRIKLQNEKDKLRNAADDLQNEKNKSKKAADLSADQNTKLQAQLKHLQTQLNAATLTKNTTEEKNMDNDVCHVFSFTGRKEYQLLVKHLKILDPDQKDRGLFRDLERIQSTGVVDNHRNMITTNCLSLVVFRARIANIFEAPKADWASQLSDNMFLFLHLLAVRGEIGQTILNTANSSIMSFDPRATIGQISFNLQRSASPTTTVFMKQIQSVLKVDSASQVKPKFVGEGSTCLKKFTGLLVELGLFALLCKEVDVVLDAADNILGLSSKNEHSERGGRIGLDSFFHQFVMMPYKHEATAEKAVQRVKDIKRRLGSTNDNFYVKSKVLDLKPDTTSDERKALITREEERMVRKRIKYPSSLHAAYYKVEGTMNPHMLPKQQAGETKESDGRRIYSGGRMSAGIVISERTPITEKQLSNQCTHIKSSATARKRNVCTMFSMLATGKNDDLSVSSRLLLNKTELGTKGETALR